MDIRRSMIVKENKKVEWHKASNYPEEDKWIIVSDENGKEHDNHTWSGHCYYDWIEYDDGTGDGYPTDVKVVKWRYDAKRRRV
jgi:hypothetical protein